MGRSWSDGLLSPTAGGRLQLSWGFVHQRQHHMHSCCMHVRLRQPQRELPKPLSSATVRFACCHACPSVLCSCGKWRYTAAGQDFGLASCVECTHLGHPGVSYMPALPLVLVSGAAVTVQPVPLRGNLYISPREIGKSYRLVTVLDYWSFCL